ncbi:ABC transporter substrate-binding protein [Micromonospora sp. CPCC 206060]|uniref:ABC transporter substrate-binding protein n=1 Tax=Micromonospora sp. CPCC 206060 TaxID=3122406 RepID=UPI002FF27881
MADLTKAQFTRRSLLRSIAAAGGLATVPGLLAACTGTDSSSKTAQSLDTLTVALPSSISSVDASKEAGIMNYVVALLCQEALVGVGAVGNLVPALATSWSRPDATTYVYKLRQGVTFTDGSAMTVDDVVASLQHHAKPGSTSAFAYAYADVASITATAADEITIKLTKPSSSFSWTPSPGTLLITSKAFLEKNGAQIGTPEVKILGTGPYRVTEFVADSHVTLTRNEKWWGGQVPIREVRLNFITDESTRLLAMRQNSIDMALNVPLDQLDQWRTLSGVQVEVATDRSLVTLAFNIAKKPWDDIHVRKAVAHAIDRAGIVKSILRGHGTVAKTLPSDAQWGGLLSSDEVAALYAAIPQYEFDLDQARAELAQSSVPQGFTDELHFPNSGPQLGKAALTLAENLKPLGINLTVKEITLEAWIAELGRHASGIYLGWYFATTGDPSEYTQLLLNSAYAGENGTNIAQYRNAEVTALLDQEQTSTDNAVRGKLLGQALTMAASDVAYQPLWWGEAATAFGAKAGARDYGPYFFVGPWATQVSAR